MITLNDERGLVRIETWEEVETIPGFTPDLDPTAAELANIIGSYQFSDFKVCGLSSCRTKHYRGYLVSTKDGRITNLGKDCGAKYFGGVDFEAMRRRFDRDLQNAERREKLKAAQHQVPGWRDRVDTLKDQERGAAWVHRSLGRLSHPDEGLPATVRARLDGMVKRREPNIEIQRLATKEEREAMQAMRSAQQLTGGGDAEDTGGPMYVTDTAGTLAGLPALYPENDLREILVRDLATRLDRLEGVDVDQLTPHELRGWAAWVDEVDSKLAQAEHIIAVARELFAAYNLRQLTALANGQTERSRVLAIAKHFE